MKIIKKVLKFIWNNKLLFGTLAVITGLSIWVYVLQNRVKASYNKLQPIEYTDSNMVYHKIQQDNELKDLKKTNKELYDSLKQYKSQIDYLVRFKYTKSYDTGTIVVKESDDNLEEEIEEVKEYSYNSEANDTLNYKLTIGSTREPNWYRLNLNVSDNFTIVNKKVGDNTSETTIQSDSKADISEVSIVKKKERVKFTNRFAIGPTISYGYSFAHKKLEPTIGIGVTVNLFPKK